MIRQIEDDRRPIRTEQRKEVHIRCQGDAVQQYDRYGIGRTGKITAGIPSGRFGTSDEVAQAVIYLASDESAWTLGTEIVVDGGRLLNG